VSTVIYTVDVYQSGTAASAASANGLLRYTFGAVYPLFALNMYENLGIGLATSVLGIISVVFMSLPFLFYRYGKRFRAMSSYDTLRD
jgi:hypothetical protein